MIRKSAKAWLALLLMSSAGCNAIQDHVISCETSTRNMVLAEKGWMNWSSCYKDVDYKLHFSKGFRIHQHPGRRKRLPADLASTMLLETSVPDTCWPSKD